MRSPTSLARLAILGALGLGALLSLAGLAGFSAPAWAESPESFSERLAAAALERTRHAVTYDGQYRALRYPGGDVPASTGVCTDVVIRSYRALGIDLQKEVHEDMRAHFSAYPANWGLSRPDSNIDHRRVPNLQTFFARKGQALLLSHDPLDPSDYLPGDLVTWRVSGSLPHIGIIAEARSTDGERPLVVHNIGSGPKREDMLFDYPITGHYRYAPEAPQAPGALPPKTTVQRSHSRPIRTEPPSR
ncbi:MAG: DUF1287 domain-containing protein [Myxococcota bacterium]